MKTWTIENERNWHKLNPVRFTPGTEVITTELYTGDDRTKACTITGIEVRESEFISSLKEEGYTHREVYTVRMPDGSSSVMWPEEVEVSHES